MGAKLFDTRSLGRQFVDRYELMGEIASGGMATVYLARVTGVGGFQRLFALKRLHPHLQGEKEFVEMFLDEARLAAGIHHPNVVPILEVGSSPQAGYYLVMEYIEGETFARLLARASAKHERVPENIVIRVVLDMLRGLDAAHELRDEAGGLAGVVHRDVSPQNVLVGVDGIGRITDFGVARAASRLNATRAGQLKGKIAYMAPEQAIGGDNVDRRADVFASAVVLWEGLAHKRLFRAETEAATLARVIAEEIPQLSRAAPRVPEPLARIVMHGLERDLTRRFGSCAEFADALEAAAQAAGLLCTNRELHAYMARLLGPELESQAQAMREWCALAETIGVSTSTQITPSFGRLSAVTSEASGTIFHEPSLTRRGVWGRAVLGALAVMAVAGGFVIYKAAARLNSTGPSSAVETLTAAPTSSGQTPAVSRAVNEPQLAFDPKTGRLGEPQAGTQPASQATAPATQATAPALRTPGVAVGNGSSGPPGAGLRRNPPTQDRVQPLDKAKTGRPSKGETDALLDSNPYR